MSARRYLACEFNLLALRKDVPRLYMWTPTFPFFATPEAVREQVRQLVQWFNRQGATGIRVYELHKSGSLHLHVVIDKALWVGDVRRFWQGIGGGRIHVKHLSPQDYGQYITKELMKPAQKLGMPKGTRIYAAFGKAWDKIGKTLVANIGFDGGDFLSYLSRGGRNTFSTVKQFAFGLEWFGVGYGEINPGAFSYAPTIQGEFSYA